MKYLIQWHLGGPPTVRAAAQHFLKTGGALPQGATQLGRWFGLNGKGCAIVEASDPRAVFEFISEWQEYLEIEATPALEDHEAGLIVGSLYGQTLG
jgi:Protein of unknown function (DUF3303)